MSRIERCEGLGGNRRPRMLTCFLGALTTLVVLVVAALATTASGRTGRTDLGGVGRPTIDGTLAAGEWSKAGRLDFTAPIAKNAGGGAAAATLLVMNDDLRRILMKAKNPDELRKAAKKAGHTSLLDEGVVAAARGMTSIQEVFRVLKGA